MDQIAKAAKYLRNGSYIGIALGGTASALKVREVCQAGETQACQKIRFTETGSFAGALGGGSVGVWIGSAAGPTICAAIGMGSFGIGGVVCGLIVVGGASAAGGAIGGSTGEVAGEKIYERSQR
jgi:hypothetical protein